jgi:hypothetical protein
MIKVRVKPFTKLPEGLCPEQAKYLGKKITARRVPIILGYVWEQFDPLQESRCGRWLWQDEHIILPNQRKRK